MDEKNRKSISFKKKGGNMGYGKKFTRRKFLKYSGKAGLAMAASAVGGVIGGKLHLPQKVAAHTKKGKGYWGKILWVDLTRGTVTAEDPTFAFPGIYENFLGGYGLGARIIYSRQRPRAHPLGRSNIFGLAAGPLTGSQASVGSRCTFFAKSPLTGTWGDTNVGGHLGPALKFAEFDAVFVTGKSRHPVYLFIENGRAELRPARHLWGKDTYEAHDFLNNKLAETGKEVVVASIGPAAERLSLISCINVGRGGHAGGRSGLGAVMGSKRLKAIAIKVDEMSGDATVPVADAEGIEDLTVYLRDFYDEDPYLIPYLLFHVTGPCGLNVPSALSGDSPVKNWKGIGTEDFFPAVLNIAGEKILEMQSEPEGCWSCPVRCHGRLGKLGTDAEADKPYYENSCSLGTLCLVDDLDAIINASEICNRYSLDTISMGSTIAFAMECFEKGIIDTHHTDGIDLSWGKAEGMLAMAERMAKRKGKVGKIFGDGSAHAAERIKGLSGKDPKKFGAIPMHVQNQDLPMHDSRFSPSLALAYKSDATPGRHTQGGAGIVEMFRRFLPMLVQHDPYDYKDPGRIEAHIWWTDSCHVVNCAGLCYFESLCHPIATEESLIAEQFLRLATGWTEVDPHIGERVANLRQAFNFREGLEPMEWEVPERMLKGLNPGYPGYPDEEVDIDLDTMLKKYLKARDWDKTTAKPGRDKLVELGLEDVAEDLY